VLTVYADPASGNIGVSQAIPGQTTGWGFTITNDTPYFLLVDSSNFCEAGGDPAFADCVTPANPPTSYGPAIGTYTDFIANNFTLISPAPPVGSGVVTQQFNLALQHGVGSYTIDPSTPLYTIEQGFLFVSFQEYDGNPIDPDNPGTQVSGDIEISAAVTIEAVPEPASWVLMASGLLLAFIVLRRRRARA
jgi:hypothetical protein